MARVLLNVKGPELVSPDGHRWSEVVLIVPYDPRDGSTLHVRYRLLTPFQLQPGRWTLRLETLLEGDIPHPVLAKQS